MSLAHSLYCHPCESEDTRRLGADGDDRPRWARPLYHQPSRPSKRLIDAHTASIAAERRLAVPHGLNLLQQAEELADMRHCDYCDMPVDQGLDQCPSCGWGG
jgi:hypothetical protein